MTDGNGVLPEVVQAAVEDFRNDDAPATGPQIAGNVAPVEKLGEPAAPQWSAAEVRAIDRLGLSPHHVPSMDLALPLPDGHHWCRICGAAKRYHGHDEEGEK